jgi:hypothetical protein
MQLREAFSYIENVAWKGEEEKVINDFELLAKKSVENEHFFTPSSYLAKDAHKLRYFYFSFLFNGSKLGTYIHLYVHTRN